MRSTYSPDTLMNPVAWITALETVKHGQVALLVADGNGPGWEGDGDGVLGQWDGGTDRVVYDVSRGSDHGETLDGETEITRTRGGREERDML